MRAACPATSGGRTAPCSTARSGAPRRNSSSPQSGSGERGPGVQLRLAAELVAALEFGHRGDGVLSARRDDGVVGPSLGGGTDAILILVLVTLDRNGPATVVLGPTRDGPRAQPHVLHQPEVRGVLPEVLVHLAVAEEIGVAGRVEREVAEAAGVAARVHDHAVIHGRLDLLLSPCRHRVAAAYRLIRPLAPDLVARLEELGIEAFGQTFFQ